MNNMNELTSDMEGAGSLVIKSCRTCLVDKDQNLFVKSKTFKSGFDTVCLDCSRAKVKTWRAKNPEKRKVQLQRESKKDYNHNKHLKATYNITRQEYMEMYTAQGGACAICSKHQTEFNKRLSVDHCHNTGRIRALLCTHCNSMLGDAKDKIELLQAAITYLEEHNGT